MGNPKYRSKRAWGSGLIPVWKHSDFHDGNITDQVVVTGLVDTNTIGEYIVTYTVDDNAGNTANIITRTVTVVGTHTVDLNSSVSVETISGWSRGTFTMGSPVTEEEIAVTMKQNIMSPLHSGVLPW